MRDFTPVFRLYGIVVHKIGTLSRWAWPKHKSQLKAETFLWLVAKDEIGERCFVWLTDMQTFILWTVHGDHMARNCRQLLIAESSCRPHASRKTRTMVLQPQSNEFCPRPELGRWSWVPGENSSPGQHLRFSLVNTWADTNSSMLGLLVYRNWDNK